MKITSVEEYGLRCLLQVGKTSGDSPVSASEVAAVEGLSEAYAQKLLRILAQGGLVTSHRGVQGGYALAMPAEEITLGAAIRVLGGVIELDHMCGKHTGDRDVCSNLKNCLIRPVWSYLSEFVVRTFDAIPLSMLMQDEEGVAEKLLQMVPPRRDVAVDEVVASA